MDLTNPGYYIYVIENNSHTKNMQFGLIQTKIMQINLQQKLNAFEQCSLNLDAV